MTQHAARLWDKGQPLDELIHRFTVGDDPTWDLRLVHWDCLGSAAHAHTLLRADILTDAELAALLDGLREIDADCRAGRFAIPPELEDAHTAIEARLTQRCGPAGEKIHTGRSRNDQAATAARLFLRAEAAARLSQLGDLVDAALARIERDGAIEMPGYTHMQAAMPSSVGQWLHAFVEAGLDHMQALAALFDRLDACPLGTGAGFGVPLPLDRGYTAELLGFSRVQRSPIDVQNSRGRMELYFARAAADAAAMIEKLACDLLLFSTAEFGFFRMPESLTTGSSIMPQKRNPDVLELMRGRAARLRGRAVELEFVIGKLPSSYHRDLQLTKEPAIRAADEIDQLLSVSRHVIASFEIDRERLTAAMRPELFAAEAALRRTQAGVPFRQAYRQVAEELRDGRFSPPRSARRETGAAAGDSARAAAPEPSTDAAPQRVSRELLVELRAERDAWRKREAAMRGILETAERLLCAE